MTGIYKITSPSGKIYIGQSVDINKRFQGYRNAGAKKQILLHRSFIKYGIENHKFEVVCECIKQDLNNFEEFYIKYFDCLNKDKGLNLREGGNVSKHSSETIERMKIAQKGKIVTPLTREKLRAANLGRKRPENEKAKISQSMKGLVKSESHLKNISNSIKRSESFQENLCILHKAKRKKVICTNSGRTYNSVKELAKETGSVYSSLVNQLNGFRENNTSYKYI